VKGPAIVTPRPEFYRCRVVLKAGRKKVEAKPQFSGAADTGGWKLYVVMSKGEFVYVGLTNKRAKSRLEQGLNAKKYGYKWKDRLSRFDLHVCPLPDARKYADGECLEAELVHLVRWKRRMWPTGQHEIHFHNKPGAAELAAKLYAEIMK
jgi:hypothetical protein